MMTITSNADTSLKYTDLLSIITKQHKPNANMHTHPKKNPGISKMNAAIAFNSVIACPCNAREAVEKFATLWI